MYEIHTVPPVSKAIDILSPWLTIWLESPGLLWWNLRFKCLKKFANDMPPSIWKREKKQQFFGPTTLKNIKNSKNWWIRKTWKRNSRRHTFLKRTVLSKNSIERSCKWHDQCLFERSCFIDFEKKLYAPSIICEIWYRSGWIRKNPSMNYETVICQILAIFENSNAWFTLIYQRRWRRNWIEFLLQRFL